MLHYLKCGGCLDDWLQDQLILFMALADGESEIITGGLTLHTRTAIAIATEMTGAQFKVRKIETCDNQCNSSLVYGQSGYIHGRHRITCKGVAFGK